MSVDPFSPPDATTMATTMAPPQAPSAPPADPFAPVTPEAAAADAAPAKPTGPVLAPGDLVAYVYDDDYDGHTVKAGMVMSSIPDDGQGPQAVVAWFADGTAILPTGDLHLVDKTPAPAAAPPPPPVAPGA
jgi:hypothetical protein